MATATDSIEITPQDIARAYRASGLQKDGIGFLKANETPSLYTALRCFAKALKKKQQPPTQMGCP